MRSNRRDFIKSLSLAMIALGAWRTPASLLAAKRKKILVLGGTNFLGPAIVNAGLKRHDITLFNRGITNPQLFPGLKLIKGDRKKGVNAYEELKRSKWDAVIDVWPEKSKLVDEATNALRGSTLHYVFVSSIAVYSDFQEVGLNENSKVVKPGQKRADWGYAEEKIESERLVAERFRGSHTILRPGPIKGWRDSAKDVFYWLVRLEENKDILGPGTGKDPLQFIDVKDVGRFAIRSFENKLNGVFNCTGPRANRLLWSDFLAIAIRHLGSKSKIHWPDEAFLEANNVRSFEDLPLWAPLSEDRGFMQISMKKSILNGFEFTPIEETIDDISRWFKTIEKSKDLPSGLKRSRELELIEKLKNSR